MQATKKPQRNIKRAKAKLPLPGTSVWILALTLVIAIALAYQPAWGAGFIWDDDRYVTQNPLLTAPDGLRRIWFSLDSPSQYFPLTYTSFYLERLFWGLNPCGYHGINLLLHAANALLVWRLLSRLRVPGAWLAAALFALHPIQVESVAWITERKNLLMGFFFLLSLLAWTNFVDDSSRKPWRFYAICLACYALALSAKTTACTLPAALLLILWLQKKPIGWRRLAQIGPFVALGLAMGLVTIWWERFHQGTQGAVFAIGPVERVLIASRALWFYAGKLLWPAHLAFSYPRWTISARDLSAYGWLAATASVGLFIWQKRARFGRGVEVAALFFVLTLCPVLGFFMLWTFRFTFVADHYQYLACLGPMALAAAGFEQGFDWFARQNPLVKPLCWKVLLAMLGALTWNQCCQYADSETLWRATLAENPSSWLAHNDLGTVLLRHGQTDEATAHFRLALDLHPDDEKAQKNLADVLLQEGEVEEAIPHFRQGLALQPDDAGGHNNFGYALLQHGEIAEAVQEYRKALQIQPGLAQARQNLGLALLRSGDFDGALACFAQNARLPSDPVECWRSLGIQFLQQGHPVDAIACYHRTLSLNPNLAEAWDELGMACFKNGQPRDAVESWQKALEINPAQPQIQNNLASVLAMTPDAALRNGPKAIQLAEQANQLTGGGNPAFLSTLAAAYAETGRFDQAESTAQKALNLAQAQKDVHLTAALQQVVKLYAARLPAR